MKRKKTEIIDDISNKKNEIRQAIEKTIAEKNEKTFSLIEDFISGGFVENLGNLIIYLPQERQENALKMLPENLREKVSEYLTKNPQKNISSPEVLSATGTILKNGDFYGETTILDIKENFNNFFFCKDLYEEEMQKLHKTNPFLAFNLELYGSNLNFLLKLGDRAVQKVLREIEMEDLAKALKDESNEIWDKITRNMSRRAATLLREDMEYMGPVKRSDIIEAKNKIVNIAKRLEESGNIVLFNQLF